MADFRKLVQSLLARGGIKSQLNDYTDAESMAIFTRAFTHPSYNKSDKLDNYQLYEIIGDTLLNAFCITYIREKYPNIVNVGSITKIKHYHTSNKIMGKVALDLGFEKFLLRDKAEVDILKSQDPIAYIHIYSDVFEAFIGAVKIVIDKKTNSEVGMIVCQAIIWNIFDEIGLETGTDVIRDKKTALKELFDQMNWKKVWTKSFLVTRNGRDVTVTVYAPVGKNDQLVKIIQKTRTINTRDKKGDRPFQIEVASDALRILSEAYNIRSAPADVNVQENK